MAPFLAFFLFFSLNAQDVCNRTFTRDDQELYKTILLKSSDSKTKLKYLHRFGNCIDQQGVSIHSVKGIPVVERLECGNIRKSSGMELFFKGKLLCGKSVDFFPSKKVFVIYGTEQNVKLNGDWKLVKGNRKLLIYDEKAVFKEGEDVQGRILTKNIDGSYTTGIGKKMHPSFVFENGHWIEVTPLRELFNLTVKENSSFNIELVTESAIPFKKKELLDTIGLKAETVETSTPAPSRYFVKGKGLKAVRIPSLNGRPGEKNFSGRYSIILDFPGISKKTEKTFIEKTFEIKKTLNNSTIRIDLIVKSTTLTKDDIKKIRSILDNITPLYHSEDKNDKQ